MSVNTWIELISSENRNLMKKHNPCTPNPNKQNQPYCTKSIPNSSNKIIYTRIIIKLKVWMMRAWRWPGIEKARKFLKQRVFKSPIKLRDFEWFLKFYQLRWKVLKMGKGLVTKPFKIILFYFILFTNLFTGNSRKEQSRHSFLFPQ